MNSPLSKWKQAAGNVISRTLSLVIRSISDEMVGAVGEVELCEVDQKACDETDPVWDPQRFAPEVAGDNSWQQDVDEEE